MIRPECGTPTGWSKHQRAGEEYCETCRTTLAEYDRRRRLDPDVKKRRRLSSKAENYAVRDLRVAHHGEYRAMYAVHYAQTGDETRLERHNRALSHAARDLKAAHRDEYRSLYAAHMARLRDAAGLTVRAPTPVVTGAMVAAVPATKAGQQWTGPELELAARPDLTAAQAAVLLGRTVSAVEHARKRLRREPKWAAVVGLSRRPD